MRALPATSTSLSAVLCIASPQAASYFPAITAWLASAASIAQVWCIPVHRTPMPMKVLAGVAPCTCVHLQTYARQMNTTCAPTALHFPCHLAPWGYQSYDQVVALQPATECAMPQRLAVFASPGVLQSTYMHWNGDFAALLFINHWCGWPLRLHATLLMCTTAAPLPMDWRHTHARTRHTQK